MLGENLRRVLRIDQHHIDAGLLENFNAFAHHFAGRGERMVAQHRVATDLPQDQVGLLADHVLLKSRQHVGADFAIDAVIDDGDFFVGETQPQFGLKTARIRSGWTARSRARGRGRTDRNDGDGLMRARRSAGANECVVQLAIC